MSQILSVLLPGPKFPKIEDFCYQVYARARLGIFLVNYILKGIMHYLKMCRNNLGNQFSIIPELGLAVWHSRKCFHTEAA